MSIFLEVMRADSILREWKRDPSQPLSSYTFSPVWREAQHSASRPLTGEEVSELKEFLQRHAPTSFSQLFPEG